MTSFLAKEGSREQLTFLATIISINAQEKCFKKAFIEMERGTKQPACSL